MVRPSSFVDVTISTFLPLIVMSSNTLLGLEKLIRSSLNLVSFNWRRSAIDFLQGRRKQVKVGGAQAFKALFHTKRAPSSKFIFG